MLLHQRHSILWYIGLHNVLVPIRGIFLTPSQYQNLQSSNSVDGTQCTKGKSFFWSCIEKYFVGLPELVMRLHTGFALALFSIKQDDFSVSKWWHKWWRKQLQFHWFSGENRNCRDMTHVMWINGSSMQRRRNLWWDAYKNVLDGSWKNCYMAGCEGKIIIYMCNVCINLLDIFLIFILNEFVSLKSMNGRFFARRLCCYENPGCTAGISPTRTIHSTYAEEGNSKY